jgi:hypothetical protein
MKRRFAVGLAAVGLLTLGVTMGQAAEQRPNVVIVFADDLGYGDLGCYGATQVRTPNIDRLAAQGRMFTDAHSASAVCTPSHHNPGSREPVTVAVMATSFTNSTGSLARS